MTRFVDKFDLFLFDLDGLLVNTEEVHHRAFIQNCREHGLLVDWDFALYCHHAHQDASSIRRALAQEFPQLPVLEESWWGPFYAKKRALFEEMLAVAPLAALPGVETFLTLLQQKNKRSSVVTNSPRNWAELIRARVPALQLIPHWVVREDYASPKPAPDGYLEAMKRHGRDGDRVVGFEDSLRGFRALQAALVHPILVSDLHPPLFHYRSFHEILDLN